MEFDKQILHIYESPPLCGNLSVSCSFCKVIREMFKQILIEMIWHCYTAAFQNPTDFYVD